MASVRKIFNIHGKITSLAKVLQVWAVAISDIAIRGKCALRH